LVTIVDPHVKRDNEYHVYSDARSKDLFVKTKEGKEFEGSCWPGSSCWLDCTNPAAREWLANNFVEYIAGKTNLFTWNDMNEEAMQFSVSRILFQPSVFSGPEITMPKDVIHFNGVEHRDVHNLFGQLFVSVSVGGACRGEAPPAMGRDLDRGQFCAVGTPSRVRTDDPLRRYRGFTFCRRWARDVQNLPKTLRAGANELLVRWYQAGVFQPFFRAHAHIDTKRREPWLLGEPYTSQIRAAVRARYVLLPLWYTLFWKASVTGVPWVGAMVVSFRTNCATAYGTAKICSRPMFMEFPDDESMFAVDDQWMVGESLCVKPVVSQGATTVEILLPGPETWYDYFTFQPYQGPKATVATPLQKIPVFMRGGTAIPRRERFRRSSDAMRLDPITWVVALDSK
ncbi:MAG: glycoside hydrolase superfamily, partial [Olpidium bornovanus]